MDFQKIRKEYADKGIVAEEMNPDPVEQFRLWYQSAVDTSPGAWCEPNAMTLATADSTGRVTARVVLMKGIQPKGIRFFTNYESQKGQQLADNPRASVVFNWAHLSRQVRIEGEVSKTTREVSEEYFHSRPRGSQLGAAVSSQSKVIQSREELDVAKKELEAKLNGAEVPLPDFWGGYLLTADRFEFWQGRLDRLHDRFTYRNEGGGWQQVRLSP